MVSNTEAKELETIVEEVNRAVDQGLWWANVSLKHNYDDQFWQGYKQAMSELLDYL